MGTRAIACATWPVGFWSKAFSATHATLAWLSSTLSAISGAHCERHLFKEPVSPNGSALLDRRDHLAICRVLHPTQHLAPLTSWWCLWLAFWRCVSRNTSVACVASRKRFVFQLRLSCFMACFRKIPLRFGIVVAVLLLLSHPLCFQSALHVHCRYLAPALRVDQKIIPRRDPRISSAIRFFFSFCVSCGHSGAHSLFFFRRPFVFDLPSVGCSRSLVLSFFHAPVVAHVFHIERCQSLEALVCQFGVPGPQQGTLPQLRPSWRRWLPCEVCRFFAPCLVNSH